MQTEGNNAPPEKSERELLLEELDEINKFLKEHQKRREKAKKQIDKFLFKII